MQPPLFGFGSGNEISTINNEVIRRNMLLPELAKPVLPQKGINKFSMADSISL